MFTLMNVVCLLFASLNLAMFALSDRTKLSRLYADLRKIPDAARRLGGTLTLAGLAQVYLLALSLPLKAINYHLALGWSIMILIGIGESLYTSRTLVAALQRGDPDQEFPFHDSVVYRAWGLLFNLGIIVGCTLLIAPPPQIGW